ncbi:hypothetical protein WN943_015596 [Citrus x changshan-huyou]
MTESVLGCKTSFKVWKALEKLYGSQNKPRALQLKNQMMKIKKNNLSIYDYFHKMKGISDSMVAIGAPMSDCDFIMSVLGGIGSESNHRGPNKKKCSGAYNSNFAFNQDGSRSENFGYMMQEILESTSKEEIITEERK